MLQKFFLYYHTIKYLKPVQIYARLQKYIAQPSVDLSYPPAVATKRNDWIIPPRRSEKSHDCINFKFLNESHNLNEMGWDDPQISKLWRYNLHYFEDLICENTENKKEQHLEYIQRWINENAPASGSGWEPYPISLRIVNWIKWVLAGNKPSEEMLHSLAVQARWLNKNLEYHILGNHILANAKALVFAGLFFEGSEAFRWLSKGKRILKKQIKEQILNTGAHFELSPMYHSIVLEDFLDLKNLGCAYDHEILDLPILDMLHFLQRMSHPDNKISFFNDAAFGIALEFDGLLSYYKALYPNEEFTAYDKVARDLDEGAYTFLKFDQFRAILDTAPIGPDYLPGHAHADTLSFEMSVGDERFLVNSGTSVYGLSEQRYFERSTRAHNTVEIDGENSSEIWSVFRVARRAYPINYDIYESDETIEVSCAHNGYKRLPGKPTHKRKWRASANRFEITDCIEGQHNQAIAHFYFHPDVKIDFVDNAGVATLMSGEKIALKILRGNGEKIASKWYPEFGKSIDNKGLRVILDKGQSHVLFEFI